MSLTDENGVSATPQNKRHRGLVILIHGTWARGVLRQREYKTRGSWDDYDFAPWMHESARFRKQLEQLLTLHVDVDWHIERFDWSGSNSIWRRQEASADLTTRIRHATEFDKILIIAHSHGGTVAFDALRKCEAQEHILLVTMATPFLSCYLDTRDAGSYELCMFAPMIVLAPLVFSLIMFALLIFDVKAAEAALNFLDSRTATFAILGGAGLAWRPVARRLSAWVFGVTSRKLHFRLATRYKDTDVKKDIRLQMRKWTVVGELDDYVVGVKEKRSFPAWYRREAELALAINGGGPYY